MEASSQPQDPDHSIITPWLVFNTIGQGMLGILLVTFAVTRTLPQRNNPCLINLIVVSFLATFPPALLFYTGHQYTTFPASLCLFQAVLTTATFPMVFLAQLCLVFDNWSELRSICLHTRHISRTKTMKCILLTTPYITLGVWSIAAFMAVVNEHGVNLNMTGPVSFVYCRIYGEARKIVLNYIIVFLGIVSLIKLLLEVRVSWMIYAYPTRIQEDPTKWRTTIQFALRLILLTVLQLFVVVFNLINGNSVKNPNARRAYELMEASSSIVIFLTLGTEKTILITWQSWLIKAWNFVTFKSCRPGKIEEPDTLQPWNLPVWDWRTGYNFEHTSIACRNISLEEKGLKGPSRTS